MEIANIHWHLLHQWPLEESSISKNYRGPINIINSNPFYINTMKMGLLWEWIVYLKSVSILSTSKLQILIDQGYWKKILNKIAVQGLADLSKVQSIGNNKPRFTEKNVHTVNSGSEMV